MPTPKTPRRTSARPAVVILAAGKGKRMKSSVPKVLQPLCGRPALWHVLETARALRPSAIAVVVSHGADDVMDAVRSWKVTPEPMFVDQGTPMGTGHAVLSAESVVGGAQQVVIMAGDEPLHSPESLRDLLKLHRRTGAAATLLTTELPDARGYGRVVRDGNELVTIVEEKEATAAQRRIREVATMVYAFRRADLYGALPLVGTENRQREYYLPDVLTILRDKGEKVSAMSADLGGVVGINSRRELSHAISAMRERINDEHMAAGVTMTDPAQVFIDVGVRIGSDTTILPNTFLEGDTRVGSGCVIGPSTRVVDSRVADDAEITFSVVKGSRIGAEACVGPFAHVRPGTVLAAKAKAGSFVEIKASKVGRGSKVPHLSYVGDAEIGDDVNIGAATVTVNYDGYSKHRTRIEDDVRIGSDTMLVAPVRVGKGAVTGAGSVITRDVPAGALAVERNEQRIVKGYRKRKDAEHGKGKG